MVNTDKLKGRIREQRKTQGDCAVSLGIKTPTFNQKINNIRPFLLSEAQILKEVLDIQDEQFTEYFFSNASSTAQPTEELFKNEPGSEMTQPNANQQIKNDPPESEERA